MTRLSRAPLDVDALRRALEHPACGGVCVFEGRVRDRHEGAAVEAVDYEAYEPMAEVMLVRLEEEVASRFGCPRAVAVHRLGRLGVGELSVWVGAAAPHREEAFEACRFMIEEIKRALPVWKKEIPPQGPPRWQAGVLPSGRMSDV